MTVTAGENLEIGLDVKAFSKKVKPELYQILLMTGSNVVISTSIKAKLAGLAFSLRIQPALLDPTEMEIPADDACGEGSKICEESDYGTATLLGKSAFTPSGKACQAMCSVVYDATDSNKYYTQPLFAETIDVM